MRALARIPDEEADDEIRPQISNNSDDQYQAIGSVERGGTMSEDTEVRLHEVASQAHEIYQNNIQVLARKFKFGPEPTRTEINQAPLVLIIGNHSSGKSSFINLVLELEVQRTALAPMDDGFTILTYGDPPSDVDGAAIVSNEDLPYAGLQDFGPGLVSHVLMKRRPSELLKTITVVDSPGMIDARMDSRMAVHDRGYDFPGVVRWFAERADVILLFFDPDNPGTTGETLQILKDALRDMDHKLELIMNKVDRFADHRDFARGYGALCWNLARAIPRLDLPHINIMYLEGHDTPVNHLPLANFDAARNEVIAAVKQAPAKRVDNIVTRLYEYARSLRVHVMVCSAAREEYRQTMWQFRGFLTLLALAGFGVSAIAWGTADGSYGWIALAIGMLALVVVTGFFLRILLRRRAEELVTGLNRLFEEAFQEELELGSNADDLRALWERAKPRTDKVLKTTAMGAQPKLKARELDQLKEAIHTLFPRLRAQIHPDPEGRDELAVPGATQSKA